ncbi:LysR substrate-binding domain-containing protein [Noviherbaspirillum suwonense]|uniref:LysR family transcriptional regulator, nitrogen assimilation regulatory protein n=1 Tax=Noviherbaspirillum suwonense TaxID=1224511 RepID=A0ABY1Q713_9BURK|nr:LysR substrate-binding domain-containing protein [Noviherbaspirillum suwonense]SMP60940.1 LysR family transcriptional regulator, nitrogen assimilation regulatory protein [Noviherbaspirillum suwonense]
MEIRQIRYFLAVVDSGSVSRAAGRLFVAQSALSKQISDLEADLDVQLLHRSRSGVFPTESGKVFYEYGKAILKQMGDAREAVHFSTDAIFGNVVVGVPQSASVALALPLINAVQAQLPNISLHINEELTGNLLEQLWQGRVDLAVFTSNVRLQGFSFSPIAEEDFYLVKPAHVPQANSSDQADISLQEALAGPLMLSGLQHSHCIRTIIEETVVRQGMRMPSLFAEINSVHILKSAVEAGKGNTIMPLALVEQEVLQGRLTARRIDPAQISRTLGICMSNNIPATNAKRAVAELIMRLVDELCDSGRWPSLRRTV